MCLLVWLWVWQAISIAVRLAIGWGASQPPTPSRWVMFLGWSWTPDNGWQGSWDMANHGNYVLRDLGVVMIFACWRCTLIEDINCVFPLQDIMLLDALRIFQVEVTIQNPSLHQTCKNKSEWVWFRPCVVAWTKSCVLIRKLLKNPPQIYCLRKKLLNYPRSGSITHQHPWPDRLNPRVSETVSMKTSYSTDIP